MKDAEEVLDEMNDDIEALVDEDEAMRKRAGKLYGDQPIRMRDLTASEVEFVDNAVRQGWLDPVSGEALTEGKKYDGGKLPLHLLPVDALEAITEILDFGAKKYAPRNWEKGMDWGRLYRAALGHLFDWWMGRGPDKETGKSHLWHAGCCVLFLIAYEMRGIGKDDRPGNSA